MTIRKKAYIKRVKPKGLTYYDGKLRGAIGVLVHQTCADLTDMANVLGTELTIDFNQIELRACPGTDGALLVKYYFQEMQRRSDEYHASPEYAERQRQAEVAEANRMAALADMLATASEEPTWSDPDGWQATLDNNADGYGRAALNYASTWARCMESLVGQGMSVADAAKKSQHVADSEGITGFQQGCAVSILSQVWVHGDELRKWSLDQ